MTELEYLNKVLKAQDLTSDEVNELNEKGDEVEKFLKEKLDGISHTIKRAGSLAKNTMIRDNYDLDIVVYIDSDEDGAGETLEAIFERILKDLGGSYSTWAKTSAIRLLNQDTASYMHVDVVPGRFFNTDKHDAWLHRTTGDKSRLKTNLKVHIEAIRDSGLVPLIRLMKFWANRNGIKAPTFVLELLVVEHAESVKSKSLVDQVIHLFTEFRDNFDSLSVVDPANPTGNDLSEPLDNIRQLLSFFAKSALLSIDNEDWSSVFGEVEQDQASQTNALKEVSIITRESTTKPWCDRE
ncbi:MAG: nucleotidyltransferase [Armatimonadetes bacterium]|nr:nucleotidyltransferase [Armatimonadota bacterium]